MVPRKFTNSQMAEFKPDTKTFQGFQRFDQIIRAGKIKVSETVFLGRLKRVVEETNRVTFEFQSNETTFDAWSAKSKEWCKENQQLLKVGFTYIIKGGMTVGKKQKKFDRSSNSNFAYKVYLGKIKVIAEEPPTEVCETENESGLFRKMNELIGAGQQFTSHAKNVEIVSGTVRRYMGCTKCFHGLPRANDNGTYYCKICKRRSKTRRICIVIHDVTLKDAVDHILDNVVCYQPDCETLFGSDVLEILRASSSDLDARNLFKTIIGSKIEVDIKRQAAAKSKNFFNAAKTVLSNLQVTESRKSDDYEELLAQAKKNVSSNVAKPEPKKSDNFCLCGVDEDDDDDDDGFSDDDSQCSISHAYSFSPVSARPLDIDPELRYQLKPSSDGCIGLALIINMNFEDSKKRKRTGSIHDVNRLKTLFPKLGVRLFNDSVFEDVGKKAFHDIVNEFKTALIDGDYSSLFFVIMSHGYLYTVQLADGSPLNVYRDILPAFGEKQFPQFIGKPKICFFNFCQGVNFKEFSHLEFSLGFAVNTTEMPVDVLECYPCTPGIKAKRSRENGSYFIRTVESVFEKHHSTLDIENLMKRVQERMRILPLKITKNVSVYKPMVFSKRFYFPQQSQQSQLMDVDG